MLLLNSFHGWSVLSIYSCKYALGTLHSDNELLLVNTPAYLTNVVGLHSHVITTQSGHHTNISSLKLSTVLHAVNILELLHNIISSSHVQFLY